MTFSDACILFIDEVCNETLEIAYNERKNKITEQKGGIPPEEILLFHGTHANIIDKIVCEGFDPRKNVAAAYGPGTYFAKAASYSFNYMKSPDSKGISYMFLSNVLIGKKIQYIFSKKGISDASAIHNYVDNVENPSIVVTPYPDGAYPKYIIAFHKNARN